MIFTMLPFKSVPNQMIKKLIYAIKFWLQEFLVQSGTSVNMSVCEMTTGTSIDAWKHCMTPFGAHVQTHQKRDNEITTRTICDIALRPAENKQGGYLFYSFTIVRHIMRNNRTEVLLPADIISRVDRWQVIRQ